MARRGSRGKKFGIVALVIVALVTLLFGDKIKPMLAKIPVIGPMLSGTDAPKA